MRRGHRPGTEGHAEAPPAAAVRSAPDPEETDVWLSPAAPAGWTGHAPPSSARPVPISHSGPEFLAFVGAQTVSCFGATALQLENTLQMLKEKQLSMERAGSLPYHFFAQRRPQARDHIAYMRWEGDSDQRKAESILGACERYRATLRERERQLAAELGFPDEPPDPRGFRGVGM